MSAGPAAVTFQRVTVTPADLVPVLPDAPAITARSDHVLESFSPRGGQLFETAPRPGLGTPLPAGELVAVFDTAYSSGDTLSHK